VNPAQVKFYAQSLGGRSKNDKKDSVVLARYGLKKNPTPWQPEAQEIRTLKALLAPVSIASRKTCNARKIGKKKPRLDLYQKK
jgi:transposase